MSAGRVQAPGASLQRAPGGFFLLAALGIGAALEVFEFTLFGIFSRQIGRTFFPSTSPQISILATFATFGVAFFARPIGALIFGHVGDRFGRKIAMSLSILLMSISTAAVGLIPGFSTIGVWAPALLLGARIVQGFAMAGEVSGVVTFLIEYGKPDSRGRSAGVAISFFFLGNALGMLIAVALNAVLGAAVVADWGWRLAFCLALPAGLIGLYLRMNFADTPAFEALKAQGAILASPVRTAFREHRRAIVLLAVLYGGQVSSVYFINTFLIAHMETYLHIDRATSLLATTAAMLAVMVAAPLWGLLGDRIGFGRVLVMAYSAALLYIVPLFVGLEIFSHRRFLLIALAAGFGLICAGSTAIMAVMSATMFPATVRYTGASVGYNLSVTLFGGSLPFVASALVMWSGDVLAPAYYIALLIAGSVVAAVLMVRRATPDDALARATTRLGRAPS